MNVLHLRMARDDRFALAVRAVAFQRCVDAFALCVLFQQRRVKRDSPLDSGAVALQRVSGRDAGLWGPGYAGGIGSVGHCEWVPVTNGGD